MKKTLIAIAAIAAVGAASAEVTLYGKLDAGLSVKTDNSMSADGKFKLNADQGAQFGSGNYETSRIGVKGSSEIASGVKGMFQLEGKLGGTDGSFSNFGRVAMLGLTGSFGTVSVGKQWTPYDSAFNDALEYNGFSAMGNAFYGGAHGDNGTDGTGAAKNSIQYATPAMGGFSAVVMYAPNADAKEATATTKATSATNYTSIGLNYANGPLAINLATEKVLTSAHIAAAPAAMYTNAWILASSYNLGVATLHVAFESATTDSAADGTSGKDTGSSIGLSIPVNKATTVALGYATETGAATVPGVSVQDGKTSSMGVQVVYAWNAGTAIYAGYNKTDTTANQPAGVPQTTTTGTKFATGVRYNF